MKCMTPKPQSHARFVLSGESLNMVKFNDPRQKKCGTSKRKTKDPMIFG